MPLDPAVVESPRVFPYSILFDSTVTSSNENANYPLSNALQRSRVARYKAATASAATFTAKRKTALLNGFFESGVSGWTLDDGGGTATFTHNTSSPLTGVGDGLLTISVYAATVKLTAAQVFTVRAGETWRFAGKFKADAARTLTLKVYKSDGATELLSAAFALTGATSYQSASFTNATDEDLYGVTLEFQVGTVATINMDDLRFNFVRDVDTLIVDGGAAKHLLRGATLEVQYSHTEDFASPTTHISAFTQTDDENILVEVGAAATALFWKIFITTPTQVPEFSQIWLGGKFYFRIRSKTPFEADHEDMEWDETATESGVTRRYLNYSRRAVPFKLPYLAESTFADVQRWFEDTENWSAPYFIQIYPASKPRELLFVFTKDKKFVPKRRPGIITLDFSFIEQLG